MPKTPIIKSTTIATITTTKYKATFTTRSTANSSAPTINITIAISN